MTLFVDTSVWSLALRRDATPEGAAVRRLRAALAGGETVHTTGIVLQELLQGYRGPSAKAAIIERFAALPLVVPSRADHIDAAELRNHCRRNGVQVGTVDALLAQLCVRHDLTMLSTDRDFEQLAQRSSLRLWTGG
ncbi:MAG: PIN domain-containing protein [Gammaproteobacteria bacterium]|nr:PIN domain-containing protein [Gammaproteobacteria bacterium]